MSFNITFNASKSKDTIDGTKIGEISIYNWDFGEEGGAYSDEMVAVHTYNNPGIYSVTLNVTDFAGHYSVKTQKLEIKDIEPPVPAFITKPIGKTLNIDKWRPDNIIR